MVGRCSGGGKKVLSLNKRKKDTKRRYSGWAAKSRGKRGLVCPEGRDGLKKRRRGGNEKSRFYSGGKAVRWMRCSEKEKEAGTWVGQRKRGDGRLVHRSEEKKKKNRSLYAEREKQGDNCKERGGDGCGWPSDQGEKNYSWETCAVKEKRGRDINSHGEEETADALTWKKGKKRRACFPNVTSREKKKTEKQTVRKEREICRGKKKGVRGALPLLNS